LLEREHNYRVSVAQLKIENRNSLSATSHGWDTYGLWSSTVLVVGATAISSIAVLGILTIVVERTGPITLHGDAMSTWTASLAVVVSSQAGLVGSTLIVGSTEVIRGSRPRRQRSWRRRNVAVILRPTNTIVSVVSTVESLKETSLAGKTVSFISANCEFKRSSRRRSDCGSGWSGCGGRGILSFPSTCPCESGRGQK
jgi:hypothetical protein